ncbi:serine carboxypeptidase-like [Dendrobium catenatum]|uniref:Carboxypeptidase n=1 Tax=Dendrobium catenatum TaxID=906689 RepID=A0A2I0WX42_9ASPA|nr:serine carboxypeptidase-like [Dendrobium catenatum]PKU80225.1 Serine carboxypeptidase 3 [Dendrobium catenatum]
MAKLPLLLFTIILISASFAAGDIGDEELTLPEDAGFPAATAEKFIRALNLLPNDPSPQSSAVSANAWPGSITERPLRLSSISGEVSVDELGHRAGYYRLPHTHDARMFYFFFESRQSKKDPVVIWLTGGPGCSSELAVFYENGPFNIADNMSLVWNEFGWDKASNLIYVDQPTGTGFSYSSDRRDIRHDEKGVSDDLYDFLQAFFSHHPEFVNNDFYITGESYAGHYIPAFASRVHQGNKAKEGIHINLKGFAIGNGLTDPAIQYKAYSDYALKMGIIKESDYKRINKVYPACELAIKLCGSSGKAACLASYLVCNSIFNSIMEIAGNTNYYDIRKECEGSLCYDFSNMEKFLNLQSVREPLGVGDIEFVSCSPKVHEAMLTDWMRDLEVGIPALLEDGIKLLVYAGEYDLICNWLGNSRWVHAMEWSGQQAFVSSSEKPFSVNGNKAGELKSHGPLTFLKVHDAGHMVPMDQPLASLEMLRRWMNGNIADAAPESEGLAVDM